MASDIKIFKYVLVVAALFAVFSSYAQNMAADTLATTPTPPDDKALEAAVTNVSSPYYYPLLFERYREGDTTLNLEDYRHLYYGFVFEEGYQPLEDSAYADSITMTLSRNMDKGGISPELYPRLKYLLGKALNERPFDMTYLNLLTYIEQMEGDMEQAVKTARKLDMVKKAIFSSGTGISKDSPWHVLYRADESAILSSLGAVSTKRMYITFDVEYFHLPIKNDGNKGYYFNNGRIYSKGVEKKRDEGKRRFEFNPLYNPRSDRHLRNIEY